jgi:hypothetical protein
MKIFMTVLMISNWFLIFVIILQPNNINIKKENEKFKDMIEAVIEYSDSTSDTGEFDNFIQSNQGQRFFNTYSKLTN